MPSAAAVPSGAAGRSAGPPARRHSGGCRTRAGAGRGARHRCRRPAAGTGRCRSGCPGGRRSPDGSGPCPAPAPGCRAGPDGGRNRSRVPRCRRLRPSLPAGPWRPARPRNGPGPRRWPRNSPACARRRRAPPGRTRWPWRRPCPGPRPYARAGRGSPAGDRCVPPDRRHPAGRHNRPRAQRRRRNIRIPAGTRPRSCRGGRRPARPAAGSPSARPGSGSVTSPPPPPDCPPAARHHTAGCHSPWACRRTGPVPAGPPARGAGSGSRLRGACRRARPAPDHPDTGRAGPGRCPCRTGGCARRWAGRSAVRLHGSGCRG